MPLKNSYLFIKLNERQLEAFKSACKAEQCTMSEVVRSLIAGYIRKHSGGGAEKKVAVAVSADPAD